ncbi:MAG: hypothetical protein JWM29_1775, partial [Solirubrobacterales bacterium]|nr:hypothetical protein [Solirubrobacterales bacterium]
MRSGVRFSLLALVVGALVALAAPAMAQAAFGPEKFVAVNCSLTHEACAGSEVELAPGLVYSFPKEPTPTESKEQGYTQAGGRVPFGITDFKVNTVGAFPNEAPDGGVVAHIRTDVAPGLATSPAAVPQCSAAEFHSQEAVPGTGFFLAPECKPETKIGVNKATVYAGPNGVAPGVSDLPLEGNVYNLVQPEKPVARASEFGVALKLPKGLTEHVLKEAFKGSNPTVEKEQYFAHTLIEGNVEWGQEANGTNQGDYHDYFEINVSTALPLLASRLVFYGRSGEGDFITNATRCPGHNTTRLALTSSTGETVTKPYTALVFLEGCGLVPFDPSFALTPATSVQDQPNGFTAEVGIPHNPTETD